MSLQERLETVEGRTELLRHWAGNVPVEALRLIPSLLSLIDEREEEIQSLRRERDTLVEAYLNESYRKA